jgi:transcriptional regulator with PAS, ATPase and Fis domain
MKEPKLPKIDYYLDESDPDIVILRRQDGAFVAAFSALGATTESIAEAAKEDYRQLLLRLRARQEQEASLDELSEHTAIVDNSGAIVAVNKAWKRFAKDNGAELSKMFVRGLRVINPSTPNPLVRGFVRFSLAEKGASG